MPSDYLDFEEPIAALENKIQDLQSSEENLGNDLAKEISKLNNSIIKLTEQIYKNLNIWQCVTGGLQTNEKAYHAAQREVIEETGLHINRMWIVDMVNNYYDPKYNQIFHIPVFEVDTELRELIPTKTKKIMAYHLAHTAEILIFLLGAMTIVEIDRKSVV